MIKLSLASKITKKKKQKNNVINMHLNEKDQVFTLQQQKKGTEEEVKWQERGRKVQVALFPMLKKKKVEKVKFEYRE